MNEDEEMSQLAYQHELLDREVKSKIANAIEETEQEIYDLRYNDNYEGRCVTVTEITSILDNIMRCVKTLSVK